MFICWRELLIAFQMVVNCISLGYLESACYTRKLQELRVKERGEKWSTVFKERFTGSLG